MRQITDSDNAQVRALLDSFDARMAAMNMPKAHRATFVNTYLLAIIALKLDDLVTLTEKRE